MIFKIEVWYDAQEDKIWEYWVSAKAAIDTDNWVGPLLVIDRESMDSYGFVLIGDL